MVLTAILLVPFAAHSLDEREVELNGTIVRYTLSRPAADAHWEKGTSAMATAQRLHEYLARGEIEAAALLSNSPKRRYEIYKEYLENVGGKEFQNVFSKYLDPANRVLAEIAIGPRRLLVWQLQGLDRPSGEFFVEVEGRTYMDDVPSEARQQLRGILEAYRSRPADHPQTR